MLVEQLDAGVFDGLFGHVAIVLPDLQRGAAVAVHADGQVYPQVGNDRVFVADHALVELVHDRHSVLQAVGSGDLGQVADGPVDVVGIHGAELAPGKRGGAHVEFG